MIPQQKVSVSIYQDENSNSEDNEKIVLARQLSLKPEVKVTYGKRKDTCFVPDSPPLSDGSFLENERTLRDVTIHEDNLFNKENTLNERVEYDAQMIQPARRITTGGLPTIEFNNECIEIGAQFIRPRRRRVTTGSKLPAVEFNSSFMGNEKQERKSETVKQKCIGDFFKTASVIVDDEQNSNLHIKKKRYATIPKFNKNNDDNKENKENSSSRPKKRVRKYEQTYLDLGQKNFGAYTCPECQMSYVQGTLADDTLHTNFHRLTIEGIKYHSYQDEITLETIPEVSGRVVLLVYNKSHFFEKLKIKNTIEWVNLELGAVEMTGEKLNTSKAYFYVANKYDIVGFALAVQIDKAYKVVDSSRDKAQSESEKGSKLQIGNDNDGSGIFCSTKPLRAVCGISRLWVKRDYRRRKIATKLLENIRKNFIYGCELKPSEVAFSQPSGDGKAFATQYTGTREFLVYADE
ncbi:ESCO1/2 acetyl-transferase-domain-containing protein [Glomus cerebriforme]|uniref:ESCO1/2 acetyl-transferase-domain-containing protein n=1 Tax=Glomus cerebriforme TaxID=658196 RepID=A0A397SW83_9GLOM|nr:ESCO1/2 acetyl-transferase-domain-containing protein [Glomus cerebriforme]